MSMTFIYVLMGLFFVTIIIEKNMIYRKCKNISNLHNKCLHTHREVELIYYPDRYELYRCVDCNARIYVSMDDGSEEISECDE